MLFKIAIVVLPVFVLIALGFISSYLYLLTRHLVDSLAKFCQDFGIPFLLFFNLAILDLNSAFNIQLEKDDQIYLFTDGFVDQFGGPKNKKLGYNRFREKLLEISKQEMETQKSALDAYFKEWQGAEEQLDDVCVIGVRV